MLSDIRHSFSSLGPIGLAVLLSNYSCKTGSENKIREKPNIIFIMADDLGYGDLGCYGQEKIETPNIDRLADNGIRFTQFYSGSPVSAPARSVLMTGMHSGKTQIRGNDEMAERGNVRDFYAMFADSTLEGQRPLKAGTITIASILQDAGYKTALVGKWGLGAPNTDGVPNKLGFDFFYGYNCQRQAHTYYPFHLWKNDRRVLLNNDTIPPKEPLPEGTDLFDPASYKAYYLNDYAPDMMFKELTNWVETNSKNPFFLYWATNIPHVPVQVTREWVDYYVEKFGDEEPYNSEHGYYPQRYPHAAYAGMISYLDDQIGKLIQQLKDLGIYENTIIFFTSDNGPTYIGGVDSHWFNSAGPFRAGNSFAKGYVNEGGIRVPLVAAWPGKIKPARVTEQPFAFYDVMPTIAEIAGIDIPEFTDGISFLPLLKGKKQKQHDFLYWEFPANNGQMAIRIGNMKALRKNMFQGNLEWELYDIVKDPGETTDIAAEYPEIIEKINEIAEREHTASENPRWRYKVLGE